MNAKIQKSYQITIGTNDEKATLEDMDKMALELEQLGNAKLPVRVHVFEVNKK
mgnify:CR=1 FL=1